LHVRPLSHFKLSSPLICNPCHTSSSHHFHLRSLCRTSGSQTLSFAIPVTLTLASSQKPSFATPVSLSGSQTPSHLRTLSQFMLSKSFCDPCRTSGSQTLSVAIPVTFHQTLKVFHLRPLSYLRLCGWPAYNNTYLQDVLLTHNNTCLQQYRLATTAGERGATTLNIITINTITTTVFPQYYNTTTNMLPQHKQHVTKIQPQ
jgi:hypothetical protein